MAPPTSPDIIEDLDCRFKYHPPQTKDDEKFYECFRASAKVLALEIVGNVANSRERSLALTKLEECVMWTNAARARRGT